jgi:hypothetical protein
VVTNGSSEKAISRLGDNIDEVILFWQSNMTRDQKEQYVLDLYEQGKTIRQIAQFTHISFRDIGAIIKKYKEAIEQENGVMDDGDDYNIKSKSKTTQAIKMFSEGQTPMQVVIELDLLPEEVQAIYRQYLEMRNMYDFLQVCDWLPYSELYDVVVTNQHSTGTGYHYTTRTGMYHSPMANYWGMNQWTGQQIGNVIFLDKNGNARMTWNNMVSPHGIQQLAKTEMKRFHK